MTRTELMNMAEAGNVDAVLELVKLCVDEQDWNNAIDWADKAAATGNVNGMYKAANLHSMRMNSILGGGMPFWGVLLEDSKAAQENAAVLIGACRNGQIDLDADTYSSLLTVLRDAIYCEAVVAYQSDSNDFERGIELLSSIETSREQVLCGLCYFELSKHDDAVRVLNSVYGDTTYARSKKIPVEEANYATAMFALSVMTRMNTGNLDKAIMILNRGIEGITDEDMKAPLRKELARYQKKLFGGWKYV